MNAISTFPVYILTHVVFGLIVSLLNKKLRNILIILFLTYQLWQFCINKRFFPYEFKFRDGNSAEHTINKIGQFCMGYCIGLLYLRFGSKGLNLST